MVTEADSSRSVGRFRTHLVIQSTSLGVGENDLNVLLYGLEKSPDPGDSSAGTYQEFGKKLAHFRFC